MRFAGRVFRSGRYWAIEVPILSVYSQGRTKQEALEMIADAIESLVDRVGFHAQVYPGKEGYFEVGSTDEATFIAFMLRRERLKSGLSLAEVARRLGARSLNAYARYEQGRTVPTIQKLTELYSVVSSSGDLVLDGCKV